MTIEALSVEEQEALFHAIIRKIPHISDPSQLQELVINAIELLLRRTADVELRMEMELKVLDLFAGVDLSSADAHDARLHRLAHDCITLLQETDSRRLPRQEHL